jgi:hypothetical protein
MTRFIPNRKLHGLAGLARNPGRDWPLMTRHLAGVTCAQASI